MPLPSKELLSDVTGQISLGYNVHELAYKCKVWAKQKNIILVSNLRVNDEAQCVLHDVSDLLDIKELHSCISPTEPEAIFKACEWILENKGKQ